MKFMIKNHEIHDKQNNHKIHKKKSCKFMNKIIKKIMQKIHEQIMQIHEKNHANSWNLW